MSSRQYVYHSLISRYNRPTSILQNPSDFDRWSFWVRQGVRVGINPSSRYTRRTTCTSCQLLRQSYVLYAVFSYTDCAAGRVTINILPDDILLLVFHFDRVTYIDGLAVVDRARLRWRWHRLIYVCRRWRSIVFAFPKFLDLALVCDPSTPVELIDIWPPLPIIIRDRIDRHMPNDYAFQAAIVHPSRVCQIDLRYKTRSQLQRLASAMQDQFPALIHLSLDSDKFDDEIVDESALTIPDGFLGESAPCLQSLELDFMAFPALPKFLLSATALVRLTLWNIDDYGYFSPEAILTGLAVLVNLEYLSIGFIRPRSLPDQESRRPPPPARTVLPTLTFFKFQGTTEYLNELVAGIDAPLLDSLFITFTFNEFIFDISQLAQFMRRTTRFQALSEVHVKFDNYNVQVDFRPSSLTLVEKPRMVITSRAINWPELSNMMLVLTSLFPSIYIVEHLYMHGPRPSSPQLQDPMQWLEILRPFTAVKNFYVVKKFVQHFAPALEELVGESVIDVLPALEGLYLEEFEPPGHVGEAIGQFVAARRLLDHPVAVSHWKNEGFQFF